jgi:3-hydroxyisobutyrate dehydrogenase
VRIAVLGMGEAGRLYAADLVAAGHSVVGFDPAEVPLPDGVERAGSAAQAASGAGLVVSLTGARFAELVAEQVAGRGACFADFNSAGVATKRAVEAVLPGTPVADVAVLAPVPRSAARTPLVVSGPGAGTVAEVFGPLGAPVEVLDGEVGTAAGRKLLRSVFMKGLAATVLESVSAAESAGCGRWAREQIAAELGSAELVDRLIDGSRQHAARRVHEMRDCRAYLDELGADAEVCEASITWLQRLAEEAPAG